MPDDLYDRDILRWSERESALLRRLAAGERVNGAVDWPHVIEELADVGLSELHAVEGLLRQAMAHLLKLAAEPDAASAGHWTGEVIAFLDSARSRFAPSMRQRIDLQARWHAARRQAAATRPGFAAPPACPWTLDELLAQDPEPAALAARLLPLPPVPAD